MSYSSDEDPRVTRVMVAIQELVEALEETGDHFGPVNTAPIRWLNEALDPLGLKVVQETRKMFTKDIVKD